MQINDWRSTHQCDCLCWWKFHLAKYLSGDQNSTEEEKRRHDFAVEEYQPAYEKYQENRTKIVNWIATNDSQSRSSQTRILWTQIML